MSAFDIHLCLVSKFPIANITPLLDENTAPRELVLLVPEQWQEYADGIAEIARPRGIRVRQERLAHPSDTEHCRTIVNRLVDELTTSVPDQEPVSIALNASGGSRAMALAAFEVFHEYDLPVFYVDEHTDHLVWLYPNDIPSRDIADKIKIETWLLAHNTRLSEKPVRSAIPQTRLDIAEEIIRNMKSFADSLRTLNWLASRAENSLRVKVESHHLSAQGMKDLLVLLARQNMVEADGSYLHFGDESTRFFVNGGWLEEYVFAQVRKIKPEKGSIQDVARSIAIKRMQNNREVHNEIDVMYLHDNRPYLIECKARAWSGKGDGGPGSLTIGAQTIYKLDTLTDLLGGLQARGMLVSYQEFPEHDRRRARDLGIEICDGSRLQNLRSSLARWSATRV